MKYNNFYKTIAILTCMVGFFVSALADHDVPSPQRNPPNPPRDPKKDCQRDVGSAVSMCDGTLRVDYTLPSYRSLGLDRTLRFVYNSTAADVRPIMTFDAAKSDSMASNVSARLFVNGQQQGSEVFYQASSSLFRGALQFNANGLATGAYPYFVSLSNNYTSGTPQKSGVLGKVLVNNQTSSPFGAGWTLDGLQRLVLNTTRDKNSALLIEGDGTTKLFSLAPIPPSPQIFDTTRNIDVQGQPVSVASGDFNGDSIPDLAVVNNFFSNVSIFLGNGDGTFQAPVNYSVGTNPKSIVVGNFRSGDNRLDLAVANYGSNNVSILLGNGNGTFQAAQNYLVGRGPTAIIAAKLRTGNNFLDLAVTNYGSNNVSILLGNGNGTFQAAQNYPADTQPISIVAGVFNTSTSGILDLVVGNTDTIPPSFPAPRGTLMILPGVGDGTFLTGQRFYTYGYNTAPASLAAGVFNNGVGNQDLAVLYRRNINGIDYAASVSFFKRNGDRTFDTTNVLTLGARTMNGDYGSIMVSDFNGDGLLDVAVLAESVLIWLGNGDGTFSTTLIGVAAFSNAGTIADFNGDGNPDLAVVSSNVRVGGAVFMLLGNGDGTFVASSFEAGDDAPRSLAVSDFNGDGNPDLAIVNQGSGGPGTLMVALGNGDGTFQTVQPVTLPSGSNPRTVAVGDFNNDGIEDLAVTNNGLDSVSVLLGNGNGTFQAAQSFPLGTGAGPVFVAVGDFNGDGLPDLAVTNSNANTLSVLINNTTGGTLSFKPPQTIALGTNPTPVVIGDFNGDGCPDLAVANQGSGTISILLGNMVGGRCNGTFQAQTNVTVASSPISLAVGDFNLDGKPDLVVGYYSQSQISILLGNGNGTFQAPQNFATPGGSWSVTAYDLNGDGIPDVAVANQNAVSIFLGTGNPMSLFQSPQNFLMGQGARPLAVADFNLDGKPDLAVGNSSSFTVSLLLSPRRSPLGDDSTLQKNPLVVCGDNPTPAYAYRRTMKDGTLINFNAAGQHVSTVDRNCNITRYAYDATTGKLTSITDPMGLVTNFAYTPTSFTVTDPASRVTTFTISSGQLTQIQDPTLAITSFQYDTSYHMIRQTNPRNVVTRYDYDSNSGRFIKSTVPYVEPTLPPEAIIRQVSAAQLYGFVVPCSCTGCPANCGTSANPAPPQSTAGVKSTFTDGRSNVTTYSPGRFGTAVSITDALNRTTTIARDGNGNPTQIISANGAVTTMIYDSRSNLLRSLTTPDNVQLYITDYTYHPVFNLVTSITDARRNVTRYDYDDVINCYSPPFGTPPARGNLCRITDALGNKTEYTYNNKGQVLTMTNKNAAGTVLATTNYTYNARGNLATVADPLNRTTTYSYLNPDGTEDLTGNIRRVIDAFQPIGRETRFTYDAMNRLIKVCDATNPTCDTTLQKGITQYFYQPVDTNCNPTAGNFPTALVFGVKDAKNNCTRFDYDGLDRLKTVTNPLGNQKGYGYDKASNLTTVTNARNQSITFIYDVANQLTSKNVPGTGGGLTCYFYDLVGNLTSIKSKVSTNCADATFESGLSFGYDLINRQTTAQTLQSSSGQPMTTIRYSYDANGNRLTMTDPQNGPTNYTYDALNRLKIVQNPSNQSTTFNYDDLSRRTGIIYPVATLQGTMTYDAASQLQSMAYALGVANILTLNYTLYDGVGNRLTITEQHGTNPVGTNSYTYDNLYRETGATHPQVSNPAESFTYDPVGNRQTSHLTVGTSCFDAANRLFYDGTFGHSYDADGNETVMCLPTTPPPTSPCPATWVPTCQTATTTSYTYDAENRLIQVTLPDNTTVMYKYDGLGRRIEKNEVGTITRYIYDNENVLETFNVNNVLQQRFTRGLGTDELISFDQGAQSYFYLVDGLGSGMKITNSTGVVLQSYTYDSFGRIVQQTPDPPAIVQSFTYTGREWDAAPGLYYYRARYYDPSFGRFLSEDPIMFAGGINFYTYVSNNPIRFVDPLGWANCADEFAKCRNEAQRNLGACLETVATLTSLCVLSCTVVCARTPIPLLCWVPCVRLCFIGGGVGAAGCLALYAARYVACLGQYLGCRARQRRGQSCD